MSRVRIVTGETALNPVARAVAKAKLRQFLLHTKLRVFSLDDGTDDAEHMGALLNCMQVVARGCELQWPAGMASDVAADHRVLRGAISAVIQVLHRWDSTQAVAIEAGVERAERLNTILDAKNVYEALRLCTEAERAARAGA